MSGAVLFASDEIANSRYGEPGSDTYDDTKDLSKIKSIIRNQKSRVVDNLVISQPAKSIKTALLVGSLIYGEGQGPVNTRSIQGPEIARNTLQLRSGFRLGRGLNAWSHVHVHDLADLIVLLVEAAQKSRSDVWNDDGIFLAESGSMTFGKLSELITEAAHGLGLVDAPKVDKEIDAQEANEMSSHAAILWGTNAILGSSRAQKHLGWNPSKAGLAEQVPAMVEAEARRLGLLR